MSQILNMSGHVDSVFRSTTGTRTSTTGGGYVDGRYVPSAEVVTVHPNVNLQPLSDRQISQLQSGGERIEDARRVYINDGSTHNLQPSDKWTFNGVEGEFKMTALDNRPWRNYCRFIAVRVDV